eukprot:750600-Hanusia_phi.AAC.1
MHGSRGEALERFSGPRGVRDSPRLSTAEGRYHRANHDRMMRRQIRSCRPVMRQPVWSRESSLATVLSTVRDTRCSCCQVDQSWARTSELVYILHDLAVQGLVDRAVDGTDSAVGLSAQALLPQCVRLNEPLSVTLTVLLLEPSFNRSELWSFRGS